MIKTPPPKVPIAVTFLLAASLASAQHCRKIDIEKSSGSCTVPDPNLTPGEMDASWIPWYFPTVKDYELRLRRAGFVPRRVQLIPRPTPGISPSSTARAGNSVERKTVFLSVLSGWSQYCFPVGAGLAAVIWLRTSHKSL